jgi:hypothetical protein
MLYVQFITSSLTSHLDPDLPECLFLSRIQTEIFCLFIISPFPSSRPLCPTVLQFTTHHQYQSCSPSLCNLFYPPATPSAFRQNISLRPWSSTVYPVFSPVEHKHKHKHTPSITLNSMYRDCLFITPAFCAICAICMNSCIRYAVFK